MINLRSISYLLFFFSGFAALVYEVVWSRQFALVFGSTTESVGIVLGVYMLGLALGGVVLGRSADLMKSGFLLFAVLEALIGIYGFSSMAIFNGLESLCYTGGMPDLSLKALLAGLYMIVPCFLIGGTLPVLCRYCLEKGREEGGENFSLTAGGLYAVNTLGAAAGAYCAGFWFLEQFGIQNSLFLAGGVNLCVAAIAFMLFFVTRRQDEALEADSLSAQGGTEPGPTSETATTRQPPHLCTRLSLLLVFFLAGASTLAHEVVWSRILSQYLRNSVYSFACVLMAVLLGLAAGGGIGSWLGSRIEQRRFWLGAIQLLISIASLSTVVLLLVPFNELAAYRNFLLQWGGLESFSRLALIEAGFALSLVFVPALLMGTSFPLMAGMTWRPAKRFGGFMGDLQFVLTIGSVIGALVMAFVLIPSESGRLMECIFCAAGANALAGLLLIGGKIRGIGWPRISVAALLIVAGVLVFLAQPPTLKFWKDGQFGDEKLEFYTSDRIAEVAVVSNESGRILKVNNTSGLGGTGGEFLETRLGLFPTILKGHSERALVMGLGTGNTLQGVLHGDTKDVDCAEMIEGVGWAALTQFHRFAVQTPGEGFLRFFYDDVRVLLRSTDPEAGLHPDYDLIVGDLYFPWQSEAGFMYTKEHFQRVKDRLTEDGIFFQWLPLHQLRWEDFGIIGYTLSEVFEHVAVFIASPKVSYPIMGIVGSRFPITFDPIEIQQRMEGHREPEFLKRFEMTDAMVMISLYVGNEWLFRTHFSEILVNTEDRTVVEFRSARVMEESAVLSFNNFRKLADPLFFTDNAVPVLRLPDMKSTDRLKIEDRVKRFSDALKQYLSCHSLILREDYLRGLGYKEKEEDLRLLRDQMGKEAVTAFGFAPDFPLTLENLLRLWSRFMREGEVAAANNLMAFAVKADPEQDALYNKLGLGLLVDGRYDEAAVCLTGAVVKNENNHSAKANLAISYYLMGDRVKAREVMDEVVEEVGYGYLSQSKLTYALAVLILQGQEEAAPLVEPFLTDPIWQKLVNAALTSAKASAKDNIDSEGENRD